MLSCVQIEHEICQRAFQLCAQIPVHRKSRSGQLHRSLKIENAEIGPEVPVRLWSEVEFGWRAPRPYFYILISAAADRNALVRQIWNAGHNLAEPGIQIACGLFQFGNLLA